ncbi:MAG: PqqD family protein [Fusobacteriaceae bacterium]
MNNLFNNINELVPIQNFVKFRTNNEYLILMSDNLEIEYLNEVAKDFYLFIDEKTKVKEIIEKMLKVYEVEKEVLEKDIIHLIRDLQWKNLIILKEKNNEKVYETIVS